MDLGRVDLNLLVVLDALLREKNVTRAGERLRLSQPATSTALGRLRKLFGDPLLVREGRHFQLTPRAAALVEPVAEALAIIDHAIYDRPWFDPGADRRTFTVLAGDYASVVLIRTLLADLAVEAPEVRLRVRQVGADLATTLERDEVDLALLPEQTFRGALPRGCLTAPVCADRYVGALWRENPAVPDRSTRLTLEVLGRLPYLAHSEGTGRSTVEEDLDALGAVRTAAVVSPALAAMPFLLRGTPLVGLLPERLVAEVADPAELRLLEPDFVLRPLRLAMYWHRLRDRDPAHRWLRRQLRGAVPAGLPSARQAALDPTATFPAA